MTGCTVAVWAAVHSTVGACVELHLTTPSVVVLLFLLLLEPAKYKARCMHDAHSFLCIVWEHMQLALAQQQALSVVGTHGLKLVLRLRRNQNRLAIESSIIIPQAVGIGTGVGRGRGSDMVNALLGELL